MAEQKTGLVVVNPVAEKHPPIERAGILLKGGFDFMKNVSVLVSADTSDATDTVYRSAQWLQDITLPLRDAGLEPDVQVSWGNAWADGILYWADKIGANNIAIPNPGTDASRNFSDEFWYLVRNSPVPISVTQSAREPEGRPVIISMDVLANENQELNERILAAGKATSSAFGSELHLVNAYRDSMNYPDRAQLTRKTGIANDNIHLHPGSVDEVLSDAVKKLDPAMVIIGATRRQGFRAALRGRKIGEILSRIDHDLLIVV